SLRKGHTTVNNPQGPDHTRPWESTPASPDPQVGSEDPTVRHWGPRPHPNPEVDPDGATVPAPGAPPTAQWAAPAVIAAAQKPRSKTRSKVLLGGGVAVVVAAAVVAVTALWVPGFARSTTLDANAAQDSVRQILTDPVPAGYGAQNVTDITCNDGTNPPVRTGDTFTCAVTINNNTYQVTATFTDDTGAYIVGRPH
ncbi:MAG: DUF4333 domain-containing protein, partial [Actinomycetia bacterium]|nr:DUF4333 domain-containing protein [Actinomycetes bacterium]